MAIKKKVNVFDVYDRARSGKKMPEAEWDGRVIPETASKLKEKYGIKMDKKVMIPDDPVLIDKLYNAGLDMLEECGVYCTDTGRIIKYTRDEIMEGINSAPKRIIYGEKTDAIEMVPRPYNSKVPPIIQGGPTGAPCSEEHFIAIHQSFAQEGLVDAIVNGVYQKINGKDPVPGSPYEILAVRAECIGIRAATMRAGRPGMGLQGSETSLTSAGVIASDFDFGMRPCDSHEVSQLCELKIDVNALAGIAHYIQNGNVIMVEQMPIYGGYAGGLEETTILDVATTINSFVMAHCSWHLDGPVHVRWGITTAREALAIAGHCSRVIDAKTDLMLGNQYYTLAGPCTEMCLLETAAQAITDTASGREVVSGVASAKGVKTDFHTGMEARMMAEACHAVAGMELSKVNPILDNLVALYEKDYKTAPKGKPFSECYDTVNIVPTDEYCKVYDQACKTLAGLGLDYFKK